MLAVYRDKETEHNWESRDKSVTRLRAILRGDSNEKFHDNLLLGFRQMVDGIIKAVSANIHNKYVAMELIHFVCLQGGKFTYIACIECSYTGWRNRHLSWTIHRSLHL